MNNILLISYLCGSSGAFLEHFLMKHAGIFNKGYAQITMYNEYDNMYRKDQALLSLTKIKQIINLMMIAILYEIHSLCQMKLKQMKQTQLLLHIMN